MANYLHNVDGSVHRQVEIDAKIYDVTLNNQFQFGIDWVHLAAVYGGQLGLGTSTLPVATGSGQLLDSSLGGVNRFVALPNNVIGSSSSTTPGGNPVALTFENLNTQAAVNALEQMGKVEVVATPRVGTLNNQTAIIKVGEDEPFFNTSTTVSQNPGGTPIINQNTQTTTVTVGTMLSITPQISRDDWISLDISPVLTFLIATISSPSVGGGGSSGGGGSGGTAPDLETKQASTIVRARDGATVIIGGLIQTEDDKTEKKVPVLGDIPYLGKALFTGSYRFHEKIDLVIFVTPHIIRDGTDH